MREAIEKLLENWQAGNKDLQALRQIYSQITGNDIDKCPKCNEKAITELRKYLFLKFEPAKPTGRKYTLIPGLHELAPGEGAIHSNETTSDRQIEWYLTNYPNTADKLIK